MTNPTVEQFVTPIRNRRTMYALVFTNNMEQKYLEFFEKEGFEYHCRKHIVWNKPLHSAEILMLNSGDSLIKVYVEA